VAAEGVAVREHRAVGLERLHQPVLAIIAPSGA
jgi:hypothetical protein